MMPHMIALVAKYLQILKSIIKGVAVLMVYDMIGSKGKMLGHNRSCDSLTMPVLDVGEAIASLKKDVIAILIAKVVELLTNAPFSSQYLFTASSTGHQDEAFGCIAPIFVEQLPNSLACHPILFSQCDHGS